LVARAKIFYLGVGNNWEGAYAHLGHEKEKSSDSREDRRKEENPEILPIMSTKEKKGAQLGKTFDTVEEMKGLT